MSDDGLRLSLPFKNGPDTQNSTSFVDPWLDMASLTMPRSLRNVLDLCEGIWLKNGTYRMAAGRIVRYFITKLDYEEVDENQRKKLNDFMTNKFKVMEHLPLLGDDFLAYGSSFSSIVLPFRRYLICSHCRSEQPITSARWKFTDFKFDAYCRKCESWTIHKHLDRRSTEEAKFWVKRWAPQQLRLLCHPYTNDYQYFWHIPPEIATEINRGTPFYVEHMPWEMIEAVKKHQMFKFDDGVVYHMREHTLAGVETRGWGVSRLLSNFAQAWYTQVLKRYNEALALDYVVPFRVLTPAARSKEGDPLLNMNLQNFSSRALQMVRQHRQDPASWHVMPFPIEYQALGGEAKNLATPELLDQAMDEMLNAIGIPAQLYRGDLQLQVMPTALRLFQQTWPHLVGAMNGWLEWSTGVICTAMSWDKPSKVSLMPVTMADDLEQRAMYMQLASSNLVSKRTAFQPWGIDAPAEQKKILEEQRMFEEMQQEYQEDMQNRQMKKQYVSGQGQPQQPGGVAPMGGGVASNSQMMTPQDLLSSADSTAQTILQMPAEQRRKQFKDLKESNETLYALVKSKCQEYRQEASSVGRQAVLSGQVG